MGGATLSKSLIQFSVDGWSCVPTLLFGLRPNYGGGNEDNGDPIQKVPSCTAALSAPNPAAGHHRPMPAPRLLDTHGQVWDTLLWGRCSFLLGPGACKVLCVPSQSLFPQSCVSAGGSVVGLMATSSHGPYAVPRSTAPRVLPRSSPLLRR